MVAWAAIEKLRLGVSDSVELPPPPPVTDPSGPRPKLRDVFARWPLGGELLASP
jgi:hypothetical protein